MFEQLVNFEIELACRNAFSLASLAKQNGFFNALSTPNLEL